jgi:hypothetical protein
MVVTAQKLKLDQSSTQPVTPIQHVLTPHAKKPRTEENVTAMSRHKLTAQNRAGKLSLLRQADQPTEIPKIGYYL